MGTILGVLASCFVVGSIPFALLVSKARGVDLRLHGSGNVGATNAFRVLGPAFGILVLLLDAAKGFSSAHLAAAKSGLPADISAIAGGLAAMAGHILSPWLAFRGGKGAAVGAGFALYVVPMEMAAGLIAYVLLVALSGYGSVGTLGASATVMALVLLGGRSPSLKAFVVLAVILVFLKHRSNLKRLFEGRELKLLKGMLGRREETTDEGEG